MPIKVSSYAGPLQKFQAGVKKKLWRMNSHKRLIHLKKIKCEVYEQKGHFNNINILCWFVVLKQLQYFMKSKAVAHMSHSAAICVLTYMCLYIYIGVYKYIHIHICIHTLTHTYMCTYMYVCMCVYIYESIYAHIYIHIYVYNFNWTWLIVVNNSLLGKYMAWLFHSQHADVCCLLYTYTWSLEQSTGCIL